MFIHLIKFEGFFCVLCSAEILLHVEAKQSPSIISSFSLLWCTLPDTPRMILKDRLNQNEGVCLFLFKNCSYQLKGVFIWLYFSQNIFKTERAFVLSQSVTKHMIRRCCFGLCPVTSNRVTQFIEWVCNLSLNSEASYYYDKLPISTSLLFLSRFSFDL